MSFTRDEINQRLRKEISDGRAIFDAFCGSGITAKMAARGGADMVTTHDLAYFRMQGLSSMAGYLPIGDANAITLEQGERFIVNVVSDCPVMAGILAVDPTRDMEGFVRKLIDVGYEGIMNCPTVALIDGKFRQDLEDTGMGYQREIETIGYASTQGVFTKAFCTSVEEALAMADVGVDNIIIHFGNSSGGTIGSKTVLDSAASIERTQAICAAMRSDFPGTIITVHGGFIETPQDFKKLLEREPRLDGYVGGSSAERFPIEASVPEAAQSFKSVALPRS